MAVTEPVAANPFTDEHLANPYPPLAELLERGPVQRAAHHGGLEAWLILGYEEVREALRDQRLSTDPRRAREVFRRGALAIEDEEAPEAEATGLLTSDPPDHTRLRRLVVRAFTPRRAEELRDGVQDTVDRLLDAVAHAGHADLVSSYAFPLPVIVIAGMLGIPSEDRDRFRCWTMAMETPPDVEDAAEIKVAGKRAMHDYLRELIAERSAGIAADRDGNGHPDLGSALIAAAHEEGRLSVQELVALFTELLIGGYETVANFIANAIWALLTHPDQLDALRRSPDRIPGAVEELLRYEGSVMRAVPRVAVEDTEIGGQRIERGSIVTIVLGSANRDPHCFDRPETLDVSHPPDHHMAFGHGIHFCPGAGLARVESTVAIATLLRRFPDLRLDDSHPVRWRPAGIMRALEALHVRFTPEQST
jgi:cytochrome P450